MVDINVDTTSQTITAQRGHVQALAFARKGGSALSRLLGNIASAKEKERTGPIETMLFLELNFSDDESAAIPVVGSKQGDTGNKPYDRYTASVKTADGTKKIPGSWFTDVIKATDDATVALHAIECCNDAATDGCPDYIKAMGTGARIAEKKRLRQRLADMRTALTKGSMLFHHAETVRTCNPERIEVKMPIRSEYVLDASGSRVTIDGVEQTRQVVYGNIIRLIDPKKEIEDLSFTVSEFLALHPEKIEGDKTITSLEATKARAPKKKADKAGKNTPVAPTTVEGLLSLFNVGGSALDPDTDQGMKLNTALLAACAAVGDKGDDVVETVGDWCMRSDTLWTVISSRYHSIKARKAAALNSKAQAETAAKNAAKMTGTAA